MPGPSSHTSSTALSSSVPTRTVMPADSGVCCSALATRLPSTCRSRASSPSTSGVPGPSNTSMVIVALRARSTCASCTASLASASRSTRRRSSGRCASRRASSSRSSTSRPIRARLALDAVHQHLDVARGALAVQLGEPADGRQRRAQLVAGVGDEPAHPVLGRAGLLGRRLRRRDGPLDLREHSVERQRQSADLGARVTLRDAAVELARRDRRGGLLDLDERSQAAVHDGVAGDAEHQQHRDADADLGPQSARAPSTTRRTGRWRRW